MKHIKRFSVSIKNKKILLLNPPVKDYACFDLFAKPLGLLKLSTVLKALGANVFYLDALNRFPDTYVFPDNFYKPTFNNDGTGKYHKVQINPPEALKFFQREYFWYGMSIEMMDSILNEQFDYVVISILFTYHYQICHDLLPFLRKKNPGAKIICAGLYPLLYPEHAVLQGFDAIADSIGKVINLFDSTISIDIDENNILPDWDNYSYLPYGIVKTTNGCPNNCSYCASNKINSNFSLNNPNIIKEQIAYFVKRNINSIAFYDDALLYNKKHFISIMKHLAIHDHNLKFSLPNAVHIKYADEEIFELFQNHAFSMIRFGLETVNEQKQKTRGMKFIKKDMERLLQLINKYRCDMKKMRFYILVGLPDQTRSEVEETVDFAIQNGIKPYFAEFSPIPGTLYFEKLIETSALDIKEPLYHNPNVYMYCTTDFTTEYMRSLKKYIKNQLLN